MEPALIRWLNLPLTIYPGWFETMNSHSSQFQSMATLGPLKLKVEHTVMVKTFDQAIRKATAHHIAPSLVKQRIPKLERTVEMVPLLILLDQGAVKI